MNFNAISPFAGVNTVIWAICGGLAVALFWSAFTKITGGKMVSALLSHGAAAPDSAKTLAELGLKSNPLLRGMLREGGSLRRVVSLAEPESHRLPPKTPSPLARFFGATGEPKEKINFTAAKFYLPEEMRPRAEVRFTDGRITPWMMVIFLAIIAATGALATFAIPKIMEFTSMFSK